ISDPAEALETAKMKFRGTGEKRIYLLSDGCATAGDPRQKLPGLIEENIKVFASPLEMQSTEALVAEFEVPSLAWIGVPVPLRITLSSAGPASCELVLFADGLEKVRKNLELKKGLTVVKMTTGFNAGGAHYLEVRAKFNPDRFEWNNSAAAVINVPLQPRILIISGSPALAQPLKSALEAGKLLVKVVAPENIPLEFSCDCIILDEVPAKALKPEYMEALEKFVSRGGSIIFTGGPSSFGPGGYLNTPLEPVFPVLLKPKKDYPPFALGVIFDNSWSMNEGLTASVGKIDLAKEIAIAATEGLSDKDWLTLVSFDSDYHNIIPLTKVSDLEPLKYEMAKLGAFGMTNIYGALNEGVKILKDVDAAYKHLVLISDGRETESPDYSSILSVITKLKMTLSTVALGTSANQKLLNTLAYAGNGRFYMSKTVKEIPAIVLEDTKGFEGRLVMETPLAIKKKAEDAALTGLDVTSFPLLGGYTRTGIRSHAWTPLVVTYKDEPLFARMRYGKGQSVAFTSSANSRWAGGWIKNAPAGYSAFWKQTVISSLNRPYEDLTPAVKYTGGYPVFSFEKGADKTELYRLSKGKITPETFKENNPVVSAAGSTEALLFVEYGAQNKAFSWAKTFGKEFAAPEKGAGVLRELCGRTGGIFEPEIKDLFLNGKAKTHFEINPVIWLVLALLVFILELFVRRLPAVTAFFNRPSRKAAAPGSTALLFFNRNGANITVRVTKTRSIFGSPVIQL
ncbi:MAG: vWA domain-containing protein, partial [Candidatus Firestonebacteria bacterium]